MNNEQLKEIALKALEDFTDRNDMSWISEFGGRTSESFATASVDVFDEEYDCKTKVTVEVELKKVELDVVTLTEVNITYKKDGCVVNKETLDDYGIDEMLSE